ARSLLKKDPASDGLGLGATRPAAGEALGGGADLVLARRVATCGDGLTEGVALAVTRALRAYCFAREGDGNAAGVCAPRRQADANSATHSNELNLEYMPVARSSTRLASAFL